MQLFLGMSQLLQNRLKCLHFCLQVLKRELAEVRESLNCDKHVSISAGEKHKRELEGLIKEIEQIKRENKRLKEEIKSKGKKSFNEN